MAAVLELGWAAAGGSVSPQVGTGARAPEPSPAALRALQWGCGLEVKCLDLKLVSVWDLLMHRDSNPSGTTLQSSALTLHLRTVAVHFQ